MSVEPAKQRVVGWKVASLAPGMASVRYRAMLPLLALQDMGFGSKVFSSGAEENLEGIDVLVIVKSLAREDLQLAQVAVARGIQVVYDLCDNIFVDGYGVKNSGSATSLFLSIVAHVSCVVTTTEPLADEIRKWLVDAPVVVIPDGIEDEQLTVRITQLLRERQATEEQHKARARSLRDRMRNALAHVRQEGVRAIPRLLRKVAHKATTAAFDRMHERRRGRTSAAMVISSAATLEEPPAGVKTILWFGNHGAPHARFGMLDLLEYKEALETIAAECPVELVVISNNAQKYEQGIRPMRLPSRYVEWSPAAVKHWLERAAVVVVPNTLDPFSVCKSANRTTLALASGVPVVATITPALKSLAGFIHTGDPLDGLRTCLRDPARARTQAQQGFELAQEVFGQAALGRSWARLLEDGSLHRAGSLGGDAFLVVVLHLVQDLDLALPILRAAGRKGIPVEAWCSPEVLWKSPRVFVALRRANVRFRVLPDDPRLLPRRFSPSVRALLTVAETNLNPHRFARSLSEAAVQAGLLVGTLQHGYENVGLTYEDEVHSLEKVDMLAHRIYIWGPPRTLHPRLSAQVRQRCIPVGCPKDVQVDAPGLDELLPDDRVLVGVFENLHWHRYSEQYRGAFLENVVALARDFPDVTFVVKPHHAGLWLTKRYGGERPVAPNLVIADPQVKGWERHTATALLGRLRAVITTPSTVALDAARQGQAVAVVAGDLALDAYEPLPLLRQHADWQDFLASALDQGRRAELEQRSFAFASQVLVPGNAAERIVEDLMQFAGADMRNLA